MHYYILEIYFSAQIKPLALVVEWWGGRGREGREGGEVYPVLCPGWGQGREEVYPFWPGGEEERLNSIPVLVWGINPPLPPSHGETHTYENITFPLYYVHWGINGVKYMNLIFKLFTHMMIVLSKADMFTKHTNKKNKCEKIVYIQNITFMPNKARQKVSEYLIGNRALIFISFYLFIYFLAGTLKFVLLSSVSLVPQNLEVGA